MSVTFGTRSAIRNLAESLEAGELVHAMVACFYSGSDGLLVLTDRRVIAVRDDFSKFRLQAVQLTEVRALDYAPAVHDGLAVLTHEGRVAVRKMDRRDSDAFAAALVAAVPRIVVGASRPHQSFQPETPEPQAQAARAASAAPAEDVERQAQAASAATAAVTAPTAATTPSTPSAPSPPAAQAAPAAAANGAGDLDALAAGAAGGSEADKDVLLGVLADLHAKGLLTADELATKIAQVTSS